MTDNQKNHTHNADRKLRVDVFDDNGDGVGFMFYANGLMDRDYASLAFVPEGEGRESGSVVSIEIPGGWSKREGVITALIGLGRALERTRSASAPPPKTALKRTLQDEADAMSDDEAVELLSDWFYAGAKGPTAEGVNLSFLSTPPTGGGSCHGAGAELSIQTDGGSHKLTVSDMANGEDYRCESSDDAGVGFSFDASGDLEGAGLAEALVALGEKLRPLVAARRRLLKG